MTTISRSSARLLVQLLSNSGFHVEVNSSTSATVSLTTRRITFREVQAAVNFEVPTKDLQRIDDFHIAMRLYQDTVETQDTWIVKRVTITSPFRLDVMDRRIRAQDGSVITTAQFSHTHRRDYVYFAEATVPDEQTRLVITVPAYATVEVR